MTIELTTAADSEFTREVKFEAAYDKRSFDPKKDYGIHGLHIWFYLRHSDGGGLSFSISTNWQLPSVDTSSWKPFMKEPMAFGVDIHSLTPRYEGECHREHCTVTGKHCYSDGSALLGDEFLATLIEGGDEALWKRMEQQYLDWRKV